MDKLCLLLGWGVARSALFLLEDHEDDLAFQYFTTINGLSFFANVADAILDTCQPDNQIRVPDMILYGLSCVGGSPGASLAMVVLQHKRKEDRFNLGHMVICGVQNLALMLLIQHRHGCSLEAQISEIGDEVQFTLSMIWHNLLQRFSFNSRKYRTSNYSATQFFNALFNMLS